MDEFIKVRQVSDKKGKGAFARKAIKKDTMIEASNVILIPNEEYKFIAKTVLDNYTFHWADPKNNGEFKIAFALTTCQFMNHSFDPNVVYQFDYVRERIEFITLRDIRKGEELLINYNGFVEDKSPVWFDVE